MKHCLRAMGIRTATDLLKAIRADGTPDRIVTILNGRGLDGESIRTLAEVLNLEPGLNPVWNWQAGAAPRVR